MDTRMNLLFLSRQSIIESSEVLLGYDVLLCTYYYVERESIKGSDLKR